MPNYRLTLSYDGTNRPGWQRLAPNDRSIQGRLEAALTELFGQPVEVNGIRAAPLDFTVVRA